RLPSLADRDGREVDPTVGRRLQPLHRRLPGVRRLREHRVHADRFVPDDVDRLRVELLALLHVAGLAGGDEQLVQLRVAVAGAVRLAGVETTEVGRRVEALRAEDLDV